MPKTSAYVMVRRAAREFDKQPLILKIFVLVGTVSAAAATVSIAEQLVALRGLVEDVVTLYRVSVQKFLDFLDVQFPISSSVADMFILLIVWFLAYLRYIQIAYRKEWFLRIFLSIMAVGIPTFVAYRFYDTGALATDVSKRVFYLMILYGYVFAPIGISFSFRKTPRYYVPYLLSVYVPVALGLIVIVILEFVDVADSWLR